MPKGRGAQWRRMSQRQRVASLVSRLPNDHPLAVWADRRRRRNLLIAGGFWEREVNKVRFRHPLERTRDRPQRWYPGGHPRTKKAAKAREDKLLARLLRQKERE